MVFCVAYIDLKEEHMVFCADDDDDQKEEYSWQNGFKNVLRIVNEGTRKAIQYIHKREDSSVHLSDDEENDYKRAFTTEFDVQSLDTISLDEQINRDCELHM